MEKRGLGRGLSALIPDMMDKEGGTQVQEIAVEHRVHVGRRRQGGAGGPEVLERHAWLGRRSRRHAQTDGTDHPGAADPAIAVRVLGQKIIDAGSGLNQKVCVRKHRQFSLIL